MAVRQIESRSPALRGFDAFEPDGQVRLCASDIVAGPEVEAALKGGWAMTLAGGPLAFAAVEAIARDPQSGSIAAYGPLAALRDWAARHGRSHEITAELARIAVPRSPWAGFALDRPLIMGILNVTPDSFSDGGAFLEPQRAIDHGKAMVEAGADIIDIGGESTRPGADATAPEEELRRVLPVIEALAHAGAVISVDTRRAAVMRAALEAGARIINDVSALTDEPESTRIAARSNAALVLVHKIGEPRTMQESPRYDDIALDVLDHLEARIVACEAAGISRGRILIDPGVGFGKRPIEHNLPLLRRLALFHSSGCGLLVGLSRKSFIGRVSRGEAPQERLAGSLAGALWAASRGAQVIRVHDVAETYQALAIDRAIRTGAS